MPTDVVIAGDGPRREAGRKRAGEFRVGDDRVKERLVRNAGVAEKSDEFRMEST
jgi:hypothetical protein